MAPGAWPCASKRSAQVSARASSIVRRLALLLAVPAVAAQNGTSEPVALSIPWLSIVALAVLIGAFVYVARR